MKKWLFKPFVYIAGIRALLAGLGIILITAFIAIFSHTHFDGTLDAHFGADTSLAYSLLEPLSDWLCLVIPLYIIGRIISESSVRFIDIAGTTALARWPLLPVALIGFISVPHINPNASLHQLIQTALAPAVIIQALLALPFIVWYIALLYNAFSVSANVKGGKAAASFIASLVIAEIISKVIFISLF